MRIVEYLTNEGRSPFARWFNELDAQAAAKVTVALQRVRDGNLSNVKGVGSGVLDIETAQARWADYRRRKRMT
jgi:putative component of toxin-antitoxin plasmid stabilization module